EGNPKLHNALSSTMLVAILVKVVALVGVLFMFHYMGPELPSSRRITHFPDDTTLGNDTPLQERQTEDFINNRVSSVLAMMDLERFKTAANALQAAANAVTIAGTMEERLSPAVLLIIIPAILSILFARYFLMLYLMYPEEDDDGSRTVAVAGTIVDYEGVVRVGRFLDPGIDVNIPKKEIHAALKIQRWFRSKLQYKTESHWELTDVMQPHYVDRSETTHASEFVSFGNQGLSNDVDCEMPGNQASCAERFQSNQNPGYEDGGNPLSDCADVEAMHDSVVPKISGSFSSDESAYAKLPNPTPSKDVLESLVEDALQFGTLQPGSSSKMLFGDLLGMSRHRAPVTFRVPLNELGVDGCVKLRESCHSEVFRISGIRGIAVLKVVHIEYIVRHLQHLVNEVQVGLLVSFSSLCNRFVTCRFLKDLRGSLENQTTGFSELRDTYCIWDKYPSVLDHACRMYYSRKNFSLFGEDIRDLYRPYFVMYMSFAGQPLAKAQFDSTLQLRSVIEQLAMTLAVGETALQLEHRGLTSGHILVKPSNDKRVQYCIMRNSVFVELHGIEASIVDFSMSRMCLTP
ncbi:unnamed protein product, partial [Ixodes persulcatus]